MSSAAQEGSVPDLPVHTMTDAFPRDVVAMRRDLHRFPELGFLEYRTAALVAERLEELGYALRVGPEVMRAEAILVRPSGSDIEAAQEEARQAGADPRWIGRMPDGLTAVVGELVRGDGPVVALRFDMDALPVLETADPSHGPVAAGFASSRPGRMHACGHDGHVAIGLAVAERLARPQASWRGTLRLIFQPAEEGGRGALPLVEAGLVDDVDLFFAGHLGCLLPSGQVALAATGFLWSLKLDVVFTGRPAHAAMAPEQGRNALLAAAAATLGLHGLPRHGSGVTHLNVGRLEAGTARNVVADHAVIELELRGETEHVLEELREAAERVIAGAAAMQGVSVETLLIGRVVSALSDEAAAKRVEAAARRIGVATLQQGWPIGGGDDATFLMRRVQERGGTAGYFLMGSDLAAGHHAAAFDFDEAALGVAVQLFTTLVEEQ